MEKEQIRLERIIGIAKERATKILERPVKEKNREAIDKEYEAAKKELNKDFKAIQWYAIQRNSLNDNSSYKKYFVKMLDLMDNLYDKFHEQEAIA